MARAGLNKHLVKQARDALRVRGQNPSLDAIRIELGNTGSKTTIHRYLKELEEEEGARLDDVGLLSETLQGMVGRLAAQLHEEARGLVTEAESRHIAQIQKLQTDLQAAQHRQAQTDQVLAASQSQLQTAQADRKAASEALIQAEKVIGQQTEQLKGLQIRMEDGEAHRLSLEDKHRQAREALEHFREAAKGQREQDQRKYEGQIQGLQAEIRQLQQSLMVKQSEATQLNRDNEGLARERGALNKQVLLLEGQVSQLTEVLNASRSTQEQLQSTVTSQQALLARGQEREESLSRQLADRSAENKNA